GANMVRRLGKAGCTGPGARVIVEKPFGTDLVSAQKLNGILLGAFDEKRIFRIDHYLGKKPVHNMLFFRFTNALAINSASSSLRFALFKVAAINNGKDSYERRKHKPA